MTTMREVRCARDINKLLGWLPADEFQKPGTMVAFKAFRRDQGIVPASEFVDVFLLKMEFCNEMRDGHRYSWLALMSDLAIDDLRRLSGFLENRQNGEAPMMRYGGRLMNDEDDYCIWLSPSGRLFRSNEEIAEMQAKAERNRAAKELNRILLLLEDA